MLTEADATRTDGLITIVLVGQYPTPFDDLSVEGLYPGTSMHSTNPCSAQIFLTERRKPGFEHIYCTPGVGSIWTLNRVIPDLYSRTVEVFVNQQLVRKIKVKELTVRGMYFL